MALTWHRPGTDMARPGTDMARPGTDITVQLTSLVATTRYYICHGRGAHGPSRCHEDVTSGQGYIRRTIDPYPNFLALVNSWSWMGVGLLGMDDDMAPTWHDVAPTWHDDSYKQLQQCRRRSPQCGPRRARWWYN